MNVIFDIDDTITNETEFMLKYAPRFLKEKYNIDAKVVNPDGYNVDEVYGIRNILLSKGVCVEDVDSVTKHVVDSFWNKHFLKYMFYPIKKDVSPLIKGLKKEGSKIYFVSLRGKKTVNDKLVGKIVRTKIVPALTKMQLKLNGIKYDKLFLVGDNAEKMRIIEDLNARIVFDDNVDVMENLKTGIGICVSTPHNVKHEFLNDKVHKSEFKKDDVLDIVNKSRVLGIEKTTKSRFKDLTVFRKAYTELVYKIARNGSIPATMATFKPLVIGEENLPVVPGPNVFVGNHRNIKDPVITIAYLKNPTHFAALKRMFEYNENIFGPVGKNIGTVATTLFVKSIGALPIARPNEDNYMSINFQTFKYMEDYLKKNSSVAIYPEGTLNRHPEENGDILPLKSNHSFKIAENGKAIVRPVAIVWVPKEVDIENRVLVAFLKPIHTDGMKANEIAAKWNEAMQSAIVSMNSIMEELEKMHKGISIDEHGKVKKLSNEIKHL